MWQACRSVHEKEHIRDEQESQALITPANQLYDCQHDSHRKKGDELRILADVGGECGRVEGGTHLRESKAEKAKQAPAGFIPLARVSRLRHGRDGLPRGIEGNPHTRYNEAEADDEGQGDPPGGRNTVVT